MMEIPRWTHAESDKSWTVQVNGTGVATGYDLSVKNPNGNEEVKHRSPKEILDEIENLDAERGGGRKTLHGDGLYVPA